MKSNIREGMESLLSLVLVFRFFGALGLGVQHLSDDLSKAHELAEEREKAHSFGGCDSMYRDIFKGEVAQYIPKNRPFIGFVEDAECWCYAFNKTLRLF